MLKRQDVFQSAATTTGVVVMACPVNLTVTYHYDDPNFKYALTGLTDEKGINYSTWGFNSDGSATSNVLAGGAGNYAFSYNPGSSTNTWTNPLGKVSTLGYTQTGQGARLSNTVSLASSPNSPASTTTYLYDSNEFPSQVTDGEGRVTTYINDPATGLPTSITRGYGSPSASTTTYIWNSTWRVPSHVVQPGLTTDYAWSTDGRLNALTKTDTTTQMVPYPTNGQTRTWTFGYDPNGLLLSVDGPLAGAADTVHYTYNAKSFLHTYTNEMGSVTTVTAWNRRGQPTSITDPNGVVTVLKYDERGRLISIQVDKTGTPSTTTITYDKVGNVISVTDPVGVIQTLTYDDARRLTQITNNIGEKVLYTRDGMGNATAVAIERADTTTTYQKTQVFDEIGRLIKSVGAVAGNSQYQFGYDKVDNLTSVTDPRSNIFGYGFDTLNRLISETDESSATVTLTRNGKDEITDYQDPRSLTTTYVRNGFGDVIQEASPDKGTTVNVYDARGLITQRTDARGIVTNFTYDNAGRLTAKAYPASGGAYYATYTWDVSAPDNKGIGRLTGISDESGITWRPYDAQGRVTVDHRTNYPAPALATQYTYDAAGKVTSMTYPSGRIVDFTRDSLGNISNIYTRKDAASAQETVVYNVTRHPFGPLKSFTFGGNNIVATFGLDTDYRISSLQEGGTANKTYAWTGDNLDQITDVLTPAQTQTMTYTPTNRLASAVGGYGSYGWAYDAVGNRKSETLGSVTSTYAYPPTSNRLASISPSAGAVRNFGYDAAGNTTTDSRSPTPAMTFDYDPEGRLSKATQTATPTENATYTYDAMSRLALRTVNHTAGSPTIIGYLHDLNDHIIAETDASGATLREYIWMDDLPVAVVDNVNTATPILYHVHTDHLMRPIRITDNSSAWVWSADYTPFGAVQAIYPTATTMDLRFPGQWFQLESGLAYNWHRHYDASVGRYLQADPLDEMRRTGPTNNPTRPLAFYDISLIPAADMPKYAIADTEYRGGTSVKLDISISNLYSYVAQNPLAYVDPTGLESCGVDPPFIPIEFKILSCGDAFRACVQQATFGNAMPISQCTQALAVCKSSGKSTIFGPGIVGKN
jgi:RHS repeat-associated protein